MKQRVGVSLAVVVVSVLVAPRAGARVGQNGGASEPGAAISTEQNSASTVAPSATSSAEPAKKVWTNEDVGSLREDNNIYAPAKRPNMAGKPRPQTVAAKGRGAKWYHDQIALLQARIPPLDAHIAQLQSALAGNPTGDGKSSQRPLGVRRADWAAELKQDQTQRENVLGKISALQDEARHNGIPERAID